MPRSRRRYYNEIAARIRLRLDARSEEHTSELQSQSNLVCRLLLEKIKAVGTSGLTVPSTGISKTQLSCSSTYASPHPLSSCTSLRMPPSMQQIQASRRILSPVGVR